MPTVSPEHTRVPPASQIVDANQNIWTIRSDLAILRNGVPAAGGMGSIITWCGGAIRVWGVPIPSSQWWEWTGSGWKGIGQVDLCPPLPPPPPPSDTVATSAQVQAVANQATALQASVNALAAEVKLLGEQGTAAVKELSAKIDAL